MRDWVGHGVGAAGRDAATRSGRCTGTGRRVLAALTAGVLVSVTAGAAAHADDVYNTIGGTTVTTALDVQAEQMSLQTGGAPGSTALRLQARNSDGFEGCNAGPDRPVTFELHSTDAAVATVSPATVRFTGCTTLDSVQESLLSVTPVGPGKTTITATEVSGPGSVDSRPASFEVTVAPPPNTGPAVAVTGITAERYTKGSAPTPMCRATDAEDGTSTFEPVIGLARDAAGTPIPLSEDGLGERVARCSYTDSRGSTAVASMSWSTVDGDPPVVRYVLSKPRPTTGWYREEVALDWIVVEPSSPRSLQKAGCDRQWITVDQHERTYTCTATSAGGTTTVTSELIRKDGTPPTVTGTVTAQPVLVAGVTWYPSAPAIQWSVTDAVSGVAGSLRPSVAIAGEGRNLMARTLATDQAGNTGGTSVHYINVDASAPVVEARATSAPAYQDGSRAWFKDRVTVDVSATDPDVQPFERGSGLKVDPTGRHVVTASQHFTATDNVGHSRSSAPVLVDATAPVVAVTCPAGPVIKGSSAKATWTASDEVNGSGLASARTGDLVLDTSAVGRTVVASPAASDNVGHDSAAASCAYDVVYDYSGFHQPIDNDGVFNTVKAGSGVPVKFSLGGDQGLGVLDGAPRVTQVACPPSAATVPLEETDSVSTSGLRYDPRVGQYSYVWKTATGYAGTCQRLTVQLADGTSQTALFSFPR